MRSVALFLFIMSVFSSSAFAVGFKPGQRFTFYDATEYKVMDIVCTDLPMKINHDLTTLVGVPVTYVSMNSKNMKVVYSDLPQAQHIIEFDHAAANCRISN